MKYFMLSELENCKSAGQSKRSRTHWALKEELYPMKKIIAKEIWMLRKSNLSDY